jgi:DNA-binding transcriptional ArsR family regulator
MVKYMPNQSGLGPVGRVFQALADPTRRAIVERLVRGPASVKALAEPLTMSLPAVMQHLQVLEGAGVIVTEKVGRVRSCRIEPAALREAEQWLSGQRTEWERQLDQLGDYLKEG